MFQAELANEDLYKENINSMRLKLQKLKGSNFQAQKVRKRSLQKSWENIKWILHHQSLIFIPKIIWIELINQYYDDSLTSHFGIKKTQKLIIRKYYWPIF